MPSKLRKALAAVKDQTSISIAKVASGGNDSAGLEVAVLKATTHYEGPVDERHVTEILRLVSADKTHAASCAKAIGRRITRTRSWVVAVKSLMLVLRIFQDGDPHFPKELLLAMKKGYKILNLSNFRDDSSSSTPTLTSASASSSSVTSSAASPWDFTAFVRTFALYLDERLDCFLTGKLQRRMMISPSFRHRHRHRHDGGLRDMKPTMLLDRISYWQRLLERAIATRPTGAAKGNRLVQSSVYAIVQESFDLYRDISDGLALLLDSFFHLPYNSCISAFHTCAKASKQFEELCKFYSLCKEIGVGRTSEYPSVQTISEELMETLQEFLKDQSSFSATSGQTTGNNLLLPAAPPPGSDYTSPPMPRGSFDRCSNYSGSHCTSLEDLITADSGVSPTRTCSDPDDKQEEFFSTHDSGSVRSDPGDQQPGFGSANDLALDLLSVDDQEKCKNLECGGEREGWELVLMDSAKNLDLNSVKNGKNGGFEVRVEPELEFFNGGSDSVGVSSSLEQHYNPFLQDLNNDSNASVDLFGAFYDGGSIGSGSVGFGSGGPSAGSNVGGELGGAGCGVGAASVDLFDALCDANGCGGGGGAAGGGLVDFGGGGGLLGFPVDFGSGGASVQRNLGEDFGGSDGGVGGGFSAGFPVDLSGGGATDRAVLLATSSDGNGGSCISSFQANLFADFGNASSGSFNGFPSDFGVGNGNGKANGFIGFLDNLDIGNSNLNVSPISTEGKPVPTFQADAGNRGDNNKTVRSPSFQADFGNGCGARSTAVLPSHFDAKLNFGNGGNSHSIANPPSSFHANFINSNSNSNGNGNVHCSSSLLSTFMGNNGRVDNSHLDTSPMPTFQAKFEFTSAYGNYDSLSIFPTNLGYGGNNNNINTVVQPSSQASFGHSNANSQLTSQAHFRYGNYANASKNTPRTSEAQFINLNNHSNATPLPSFQGSFIDSNNLHVATVQPSFHRHPKTITPFDPANPQPTFHADFTNASTNTTSNAIVPPGSFTSNNDMFPSTPTFQAIPTFSTSIQHGFQANENDPFAQQRDNFGAMDQQSLMKQQQLWLQNQTKIIAKHFS